MLTISPKISDLIKENLFQVNLTQNDVKVGQKYFSADFTSFWDLLTGSLSKGFQKQALLSILISTSFGVNNFRNTLPMELIFF